MKKLVLHSSIVFALSTSFASQEIPNLDYIAGAGALSHCALSAVCLTKGIKNIAPRNKAIIQAMALTTASVALVTHTSVRYFKNKDPKDSPTSLQEKITYSNALLSGIAIDSLLSATILTPCIAIPYKIFSYSPLKTILTNAFCGRYITTTLPLFAACSDPRIQPALYDVYKNSIQNYLDLTKEQRELQAKLDENLSMLTELEQEKREFDKQIAALQKLGTTQKNDNFDSSSDCKKINKK